MNTKLGRVEVYATVGFLGLAAFALGFAAEVTKVREVSEDSYGTCIYPRSPASFLTYVAAFATFIAAIIVCVATRCGSSRKCTTDHGFFPQVIGINFLFYMWLVAYFSIDKLLLGALINQKYANTSSACKIVRFAVFTKGGILGLVSCAFGLLAYGFISKSYQSVPVPPVEPQIALGTPLPSYKP